MVTPTPAASGNIDVRPSSLHFVAGSFAGRQTPFHQGAHDLLTELHTYPDAGGYGTAAQGFATAYVEAGTLFLEVWGKSVESIGGAAIGFASTANNYARAEAANDASGKTEPPVRPLPHVIEKAPDYGAVPDLRWGDDDGGDDLIRGLLEHVPGVVWHVIRPLLRHALRWGKVAEVHPFPQQHYLDSLSQAWSHTTVTLSTTETMLTGYVDGITRQSDSEWYDAMRQFCSALWGTTAWGADTPGAPYRWRHDSASGNGASHPVMSVLFDSGEKIAQLLRELAEAAVELNHQVWEIYLAAVKQAVGDLDLSDGLDMEDVKEGAKMATRVMGGLLKAGAEVGVETTLNLDTAALNAVVEHYNSRVDALTPQFRSLKPHLEEARLSAPTYDAEEARAEAFGSRALNDFKKEHQWTVPDDAARNHTYPLDLAGQEYMENSHGVDKHVGKTDAQLAQRLRDQSNIPAASTFTDLADAQKYTQQCIDINQRKIAQYLDGGPPYRPPNLLVTYQNPDGPVTGRSISKNDYRNAIAAGQAPHVVQSHGVQIRVKPAPGLHPPFTIITSTPTRS